MSLVIVTDCSGGRGAAEGNGRFREMRSLLLPGVWLVCPLVFSWTRKAPPSLFLPSLIMFLSCIPASVTCGLVRSGSQRGGQRREDLSLCQRRHKTGRAGLISLNRVLKVEWCLSCSGCISVDELSSLGLVCVCPFESGERGAECGPAEFCSSVIGDFPACVAMTTLLPGRVEGLDFPVWGEHSAPFCRCPREGQREGAA